jgi:hypothetical protein
MKLHSECRHNKTRRPRTVNIWVHSIVGALIFVVVLWLLDNLGVDRRRGFFLSFAAIILYLLIVYLIALVLRKSSLTSDG